MKKIMSRGVVSALVIAAATLVGCMTAGDDDSDATVETSQAVTRSFESSCFQTGWAANTQPVQAITHAWANGGCRRFDGSISGPQDWRGQCFTNVSNCDGRIVCQNHCP